MKKISALLLAVVMLLSFAGCGSSETTPETTKDNYTFTYNGTEIMLDADAEPVIAALGEAKSYTEEPSCAFDGMDKTYYYGSFYLSTYPMEDKDFVFSIWFVDDSLVTAEGIRIGSTQAEVEAAYGADCFAGTNACTQTKGESKLTILVADGYVSSIQYEMIFD